MSEPISARGDARAPAARHEDRRLVTGRGRFAADWNLPGQAHAHMFRADRAHARIRSIDLDPARSAPGVLLVLTADDVAQAGFDPIPGGPVVTGADGQPQRKARMPILAAGHVRFVGEPIAMIIAETALQARDAAESIVVDYEDLPAVTTVADALAPDAPRLHEALPGNLSVSYEHGDASAVATAFARAARTSTRRVESQRLAGSPMEVRACLASHDTARGVTVIHTPTQGMLGMRGVIAEITHWPASEIEVVAQDVGGSFGVRSNPYPEQILVMLAARRLGRPVKWVATRSELFGAEFHGRALALTGSIALDAEGRILAIRFEDEVDVGAYTCYWSTHIGTKNLSITMGGVYRVPALHMRSRLVVTNTVPITAYRGAGRPDIAFAIECLVDHAAAEHGLDPVALRRLNFVPGDAFPYTTANGTVYDCGDFDGVLDDALSLSGYAGFPARRDAAARRGRLRGIGLACYLEASGAGGAPKDQVSCRFGSDGRITLFGMTGPSGQGHETSFARIVADGIGVDQARIDYRAGDPAQALVGNNTGGSRSLYGAGSAFRKLAERLVELARPHAARELGAESVTWNGSVFAAAGDTTRTIGIEALARRLAGGQDGAQSHPLDCEADAVSGVTFPNGCHVAEIEIDPDTGVATLVDYTAVDDLGNVVSPQLVQGQVHGGVAQGAGQAFLEAIVYERTTGQLLTGSFMDYAMPRAGILPSIRNASHPVPTALNALGAKGVGESGCSGSLPAIANAMADALRRAGAGPIDMPYTPPRVWQALAAARAS